MVEFDSNGVQRTTQEEKIYFTGKQWVSWLKLIVMAYNEPPKKDMYFTVKQWVLWLNLIVMAYNKPPKKKKSTLLLSNYSYGWIW